jgi:uncharacterized protein YndB with AHSA1/START domain
MTSKGTAADRHGTIVEIEGRPFMRFERRLEHPIERVWAAITEPEQLRGWIADGELELRQGGKVRLEMLNQVGAEEMAEHEVVLPEGYEPDDAPQVIEGTVTAIDPPRLLEYDGPEFGVLRWELRAEGDSCVLTFLNSPPQDWMVAGMAPQMLAGWHGYMDQLEDVLAGNPIKDWSKEGSMDDWAELREQYAAELG